MKLLFLAALVLIVLPLSSQADPLAIGGSAPALVLVDQDGQSIDFKSIYAKGTTLVYFYPKADTPGCTKQACSLRDNWAKLKDRGIQVLGISEDPVESQKKFSDKYTLPFPLLADVRGRAALSFNVPLNGRVTKRQSFLIKGGKVVWMMLDKTSTETHADDVLKADEETSAKKE